MMRIDGNIVSDKTNVDSDVEAIKKSLTTHGFIKIFDNFAEENIFKGKLTALEKFIKYRNLDLAKQENESKKPKEPKDESKEPKWCPVIYLDDPMTPGEVITINIKNAYEDSE